MVEKDDRQMKKVLIVSLAFPPLPVVGIYRMAKFCKYLPEMGWQPHVLTEKIRDVKVAKDWQALKDIGEKTNVVRTMNFQPFYWWANRPKREKVCKTQLHSPVVEQATPAKLQADSLTISIKKFIKNRLHLIEKILTVPDARLFWIPQAFLSGLRLIFREKIDVIFSSSPPPTNHILGYLLSVFSGRPHIIEYRDLWTLTGAYFMRNIPEFLQKYDKSWEKRILKHSSGVVVVTNTFKSKLVTGFPDIISDRIAVIYNGADKADFAGVDLPESKNEHFTISYFGNLYGFRDPTLFLKAFVVWLDENSSIKDKVRVNFWGSDSSDFLPNFEKYGLDKMVSFLPRIPQKKVISEMFRADLLLLIQGIDKRVADSIPTKLFEYIATGKPILAFFPEGEAADIISRRSDCLVISHTDIKKIVQYLQHRFEQWEKTSKPPKLSLNIRPEFSRRNQAKQLAEFFNNVIS